MIWKSKPNKPLPPHAALLMVFYHSNSKPKTDALKPLEELSSRVTGRGRCPLPCHRRCQSPRGHLLAAHLAFTDSSGLSPHGGLSLTSCSSFPCLPVCHITLPSSPVCKGSADYLVQPGYVDNLSISISCVMLLHTNP